jgi:hypothetical protein
MQVFLPDLQVGGRSIAIGAFDAGHPEPGDLRQRLATRRARALSASIRIASFAFRGCHDTRAIFHFYLVSQGLHF